MKGKILLSLGIVIIPFALKGQTSFLYNTGVMSVVGTTAPSGTNPQATDTKLYIGGNLIVESTSTGTVGTIYMDKAQVVLTGDLVRNDRPTAGGATPANSRVFVYPTTGATAANSNFIFRNTTLTQNIKGSSTVLNFTAKGLDFVDFPNVFVDNPNTVVLAPNMAAQVQNLTPITGRFVLDARELNTTDILPNPAGTLHTVGNSSVMAHLLVNGTHTNNFTTAETSKLALSSYPGVQVNMQLTTPPMGNTQADENKRLKGEPLAGMGVPFKQMYSDYFSYNFFFLPTPGQNTIFNNVNNTMTDPTKIMTAGEGFLIGIDLRGPEKQYYTTDLSPTYATTEFNQRFTGSYKFNRLAFGNKNLNNLYTVNAAYTTAADAPVSTKYTGVQPSTSVAYTGEVLQTTDVAKTLVKGLNYLANPFTCPLDISGIIDGDGVTKNTAWNALFGNDDGTAATAATAGDIANRVWVLDPSSRASGRYNLFSGSHDPIINSRKIVAIYTYTVVTREGSTATVPDYDDGSGTVANGGTNKIYLAPLQMFVLYARKDNVALTIPASARSIADDALFLRSAEDSPKDDFLFQVTDEDDGATSRAAVVLRTLAEKSSKPFSDVVKFRTAVGLDADGKTTITAEEGCVRSTYSSTLYTKNTDGTALESKYIIVPEDGDLNEYNSTSSTTLYLTPALVDKNISIRSFRNYTKGKVDQVWLDDSKTGNKTLLSDGAEYKTTTTPSDTPDRFTLRFVRYYSGIEDDIINPDKTNITAYYANSVLTVSGFNDSDYGSLVSVYDIQGRLLNKAKVDGVSVEFRDGYSAGAYIVKVTGKRSYVTKFLAR